jgi:hypothetical protein
VVTASDRDVLLVDAWDIRKKFVNEIALTHVGEVLLWQKILLSDSV